MVVVYNRETQINQIFLNLPLCHMLHNSREIRDIGIDYQVAHLLVTAKTPEHHRDQKTLAGKNGKDNGDKITHHQQDNRVNLIKIIRKEEMNTKDC